MLPPHSGILVEAIIIDTEHKLHQKGIQSWLLSETVVRSPVYELAVITTIQYLI